MDDEKILKKIQDSAENVEIPESLKPEAIKIRLKEQQARESVENTGTTEKEEKCENRDTGAGQEKKPAGKVIPMWRRHIAQAAAALVVLIGAGTLAKTGVLDRENTQTMSESAGMDAVAEEETAESETVQAAEDTAESEAVQAAEDTAESETVQAAEDTAESEAVQAEEDTAESDAMQAAEETAESDAMQAAEETAESEAVQAEEDTAESDAVQAAEETAESAALQTAGTNSAAAESSSAETAADSGIQSVASYQELYEFLKAYQEAESSEWDTGVVYSAVMASEDVATADIFNSTDSSDASAMIGSSAEIEEEAVEIDEEDTAVTQESAESDSSDYSTTNVQEEGVDEADIVKTDGKYLYALGSDGVLRIVEAEDLTLAASLTVGDGTGDVKEIYLDGSVLQVIRQSMEYISVQGDVDMSDGSSVRSWYDYPVTRTTVATYDVSDPENPGQQGTYSQDGSYLTSRRNGDYLYLFTSYSPDIEAESEEEEYFVPNAGGGLLPCEAIYYLGDKSDVSYNGGTFLVAGSLKDGAPDEAADRMAVVGGGDTFYVSQKNVYAASDFWSDGDKKTDLVRFGYEDGSFTPGSSCRLDGYLNDNFSMDEYEDHLRLVLTTNRTQSDDGTEISTYEESNHLYILDENLEITGKIKNLAKGETIQSARFLGDTGYFVTYENTDPLFSVDLSDPENPKVLGELEVTGFSAYLHAYGTDRLLGLGWETDPDTGATLGLKCSLFDTSDPADVKETDRLVLGNVDYCKAVDSQYKAILVNADKNLFGFAYAVYKDDDSWEYQYYYGLFTCDEESGIRALAYIRASEELFGAEGEYQNLRGVYIGDTFYLVGDGGVESYDMASEDFCMTASLYWEE